MKCGLGHRQRSRRWLACALVVPLVPISAHAADRWYEVKSPHFIVYSNAKEDVALDVAAEFEQVRALFRMALPRARTEQSRSRILAVKNEKSLKELLPSYWKTKNRARPAGIFRPSDKAIAMRVDVRGDNPYDLIYHEYFHTIVDVNAPGLPSWLNEGLASFWQNTTFRDDKIVAGQPSGYYIGLLRDKALLPLEELFTSGAMSDDDRTSMFYAQSWALTHYFLLGDHQARAHLLQEYITLVNAGNDSLAAAHEAFGDLDELGEQIQRYIARPLFSAMAFSGSPEVNRTTFTSREISEAESFAVRGHFLALGDTPDEGEKFVNKSLREPPFPSLGLEAMGWITARRGERAAANTWFDKASASPNATHVAHYMSALGKPTTPDKEKQFLAAISLDRSYAPAYVGLAFHYAETDETLARSLAMVQAAADHEPSSPANRLLVARVLTKMGEHEHARTHAADAARLAIWSGRAGSANNVCWFGSLTGFVNDVIDACEFAVKRQPKAHGYADSRGLALALIGKYGRAIADFEFFLSATDRRPEDIESRRAWIAELERGENPFDEATLARLLDQPF